MTFSPRKRLVTLTLVGALLVTASFIWMTQYAPQEIIPESEWPKVIDEDDERRLYANNVDMRWIRTKSGFGAEALGANFKGGENTGCEFFSILLHLKDDATIEDANVIAEAAGRIAYRSSSGLLNSGGNKFYVDFDLVDTLEEVYRIVAQLQAVDHSEIVEVVPDIWCGGGSPG